MAGYSRAPLRSKLVLLTVGTCFSSLFLFLIAFSAIEVNNQRIALADSHLLLSRFVANVNAAAIAFEDSEAAEESLARVQADSTVRGVQIFDRDGGLFAEKFWSLEPSQLAQLRSRALVADQMPIFETSYLIVGAPVELDGETIGWVRMFVGLDLLNLAILRVLTIGAIVALGLMLVSAAVSVSVAKRILTPINNLVSTVNRVSKTKDFSLRVASSTQDEIGSLGIHFNEMLRAIEERDQELADHREKLETLVETRTRALSARNNELKKEIAEREKSQQQLLIAKEEAEAASKAKSDFLANMSHEIRTPMNAVIGLGDLLAQTHLSARQERFVDLIRKAGRGLLAIINDVLDFSKLQADGLSIVQGEVNIRELVEEVGAVLSGLAEEKRLDFFLFVSDDVPETVTGDEKRIRQVLINLVSNAIKFTERGEVSLIVNAEETGTESLELSFAVADTGMGIPADQHGKIFEMFQQIDGTQSRQFGGTGLGLAISRSLTELMGGSIELVSEPNVGSTFTLVLPAKELTPHKAKVQAGLFRVLVVESSTTGKQILSNYVDAWGGCAQFVGSGEAALETLGSGQLDDEDFSCVVIDGDASGSGGIELVNLIRELPERKELPIIILFGNASSENLSRVAGDDNCTWLGKPFSKSGLLNAIMNATKTSVGALFPGVGKAEEPLARDYGSRVLLVEDNLVNQEVATENLEQLGCQVEIAGTGNAAVSAFEEASFDLIFMDCQLPGIDGYATTRLIRKLEKDRNSGEHVTIIALTAHAMEGDEQKCRDAGMDDYLAKPFRPEDLVKCLDRWCAGSGNSSESNVVAMNQEQSATTPPAISDSACTESDKGRQEPSRGDKSVITSAREVAAPFDAQPADQHNGLDFARGRNGVEGQALQRHLAEKRDPHIHDSSAIDGNITGTTSPIDEKKIGELKARKPELWRRLARAFVEEAKKAETEVSRLVSDGHYARLEFIAHATKSAAANVGASRLSVASKKLELAARTNGREIGKKQVDEFLNELRQVIAALSGDEPDAQGESDVG